jgi:flagellar protein FliL
MKLVVIGLVALVLLGGGGGAAWWWFVARPKAAGEAGGAERPKEKETKAEKKPAGGGMVALDQFLVNLADKDASRFLRVKLGLVVETKAEAEETEKDDVAKARLRSAILEVLSQQTAETLVTPEGKSELKKLIAERASAAGPKVLDVLFTDFVVQF